MYLYREMYLYLCISGPAGISLLMRLEDHVLGPIKEELYACLSKEFTEDMN